MNLRAVDVSIVYSTYNSGTTLFDLTKMCMLYTVQKVWLENVATANALQLEVARATPVLFRFNYDAMPSLKSLTYPFPYSSVSAAAMDRLSVFRLDVAS